MQGVGSWHWTCLRLAASRLHCFCIACMSLQEMCQQSLRQSPICCNAVISACDKGGQWQRALAFLSGISASSVSKLHDTEACGPIASKSMRSLVCSSFLVLFTLDIYSFPFLFRRFPLTLLRFCYNSAISACARAAEWRMGIRLLSELKSLLLRPTVPRPDMSSF